MKSVFSTVPEYIEFSIHILVGAKTKLTQGFPHASKQVMIKIIIHCKTHKKVDFT